MERTVAAALYTVVTSDICLYRISVYRRVSRVRTGQWFFYHRGITRLTISIRKASISTDNTLYKGVLPASLVILYTVGFFQQADAVKHGDSHAFGASLFLYLEGFRSLKFVYTKRCPQVWCLCIQRGSCKFEVCVYRGVSAYLKFVYTERCLQVWCLCIQRGVCKFDVCVHRGVSANLMFMYTKGCLQVWCLCIQRGVRKFDVYVYKGLSASLMFLYTEGCL